METSTAANQPLIDGSGSAVGNCEGRPFRRRRTPRNFSSSYVLNDRQAAIAAAVYTICASSVTFFGYCFLAVATSYQAKHLADVYWGVQASYSAVMMAELTALCLSTTLLIAIYQENCSLMVPWVLGFIGSMSLEALAIVYSNVLRDHINQSFDRLCHFEVGVFLSKTFINILVIGAIVRLYRQLKDGVTWRVNDIYEL